MICKSPRDSSEPPCDLEATGSIESDIWFMEPVVVISDERVHSGMLCLLNLLFRGTLYNFPLFAGRIGREWPIPGGQSGIREVLERLA